MGYDSDTNSLPDLDDTPDTPPVSAPITEVPRRRGRPPKNSYVTESTAVAKNTATAKNSEILKKTTGTSKNIDKSKKTVNNSIAKSSGTSRNNHLTRVRCTVNNSKTGPPKNIDAVAAEHINEDSKKKVISESTGNIDFHVFCQKMLFCLNLNTVH